jgi:Lar family restriction alleviation protein
MDELKPCPFCGGKVVYSDESDDPYWRPSFYDPDSRGNKHRTIYCESCSAQIDVYETEEQATKAWNNRK